MSHMITCETNMTSRKTLLKSLDKMGIPQEAILCSDTDSESIELRGYGQQRAAAEIVIKSDIYHKGYGDVGFIKNDSGSYICIVDDMDDVGSLARKAGLTKQFSQSVNQWYSAITAQQALKKQGLMVKIKQQDEKLVVVATG